MCWHFRGPTHIAQQSLESPRQLWHLSDIDGLFLNKSCGAASFKQLLLIKKVNWCSSKYKYVIFIIIYILIPSFLHERIWDSYPMAVITVLLKCKTTRQKGTSEGCFLSVFSALAVVVPRGFPRASLLCLWRWTAGLLAGLSVCCHCSLAWTNRIAVTGSLPCLQRTFLFFYCLFQYSFLIFFLCI